MDNTSEQVVNSNLKLSDECLSSNHFGVFYWYVIVVICALFGTPAYLWCFWIYFCTEQKIKETQLFLLNYTILELIYCLECSIETLNMFIFKNETLWSVIYFIFGLTWTGRPLLQTCICIEQYMAVLHPVTFLTYKSIKYRFAAAAVVWLMACGYGVYEIYTVVYPDFIFTLVFSISMAVISFCWVSVLCALKNPGPGDTHITKQTGRDEGNQQKRNAFNTIFLAWLLILFTYLPQALLMILTRTRIDDRLFQCDIIPFVNSLIVYGVIVTPMMKLYKERHIKCLKNQKEIS